MTILKESSIGDIGNEEDGDIAPEPSLSELRPRSFRSLVRPAALRLAERLWRRREEFLELGFPTLLSLRDWDLLCLALYLSSCVASSGDMGGGDNGNWLYGSSFHPGVVV